MLKRPFQDLSKTLDHALLYILIKEGHIVLAVLKDVLDDILDVAFSAFHVVLKVCKGHFGLYHPKLGKVTRCVGIFGSKGWAEGVDVRKGARIGFSVKLP